ncbi:MAG: hypothetical protein ACRCXC_03605 [Legionella sp.]
MRKCILSVLLFFASIGVHADTMQSSEVLTNKIEEHIRTELAAYKEGTIRVSADKIDSR